MKRTSILFLIAAVALTSSLCGVFFYSPTAMVGASVSKSIIVSEEDFSLETAKSELTLCSLSYDEAALEEELTSRGYTDFMYCEKKQETNFSNGIAFGIARCRKDSTEYISVTFRGTKDKEWYSNFQIGEGAEHAGFSSAADFSCKEIDSYLENLSIDKQNVIIRLTGHSRGGAVANLCAKRMSDSNCFGCVSAYTFACPNTTTADSSSAAAYKNIRNIINPEDFICYIPLSCWGYKRYGTDFYLPTKSEKGYYDLYSSMQDKYFENTQSAHIGYPDGDRDVSRFIEALNKICASTHDYYNKEITLFPHSVTMYEYMQSAAAFLTSEQTMSQGMILLSSGASPVFSPLTKFIMQGISIDSLDATDISTTAIGCAHSTDSYMAWLGILGEDYYMSKSSE